MAMTSKLLCVRSPTFLESTPWNECVRLALDAAIRDVRDTKRLSGLEPRYSSKTPRLLTDWLRSRSPSDSGPALLDLRQATEHLTCKVCFMALKSGRFVAAAWIASIVCCFSEGLGL